MNLLPMLSGIYIVHREWILIVNKVISLIFLAQGNLLVYKVAPFIFLAVDLELVKELASRYSTAINFHYWTVSCVRTMP